MTIKVKRRATATIGDAVAGSAAKASDANNLHTPMPLGGRVIPFDGGLFPVRPLERDVYVGIDPSLVGFTISVSDDERRHFAWRFTATKEWPLVLRLMDIERFICWKLQSVLLSRLTVKCVAMENPAYGSEFGREILGAVQSFAMRALVSSLGASVPEAYPYMVAPNSLKKFVTGKGSGPKDQISKYLLKKYNIDVPNITGANDLADSLGLSLLAGTLYRDDPITQAEKDVLKTVRRNNEWAKYQAHASTMKETPQSSG